MSFYVQNVMFKVSTKRRQK